MRQAGNCVTVAAAVQRVSLVSVELRNEGYVAIRCSTEVRHRMCVGQDAIVTHKACEARLTLFRGQNLQAAPVSLGEGCSLGTTSPTFLTGKLLGPYALEPFMVELFSAPIFSNVETLPCSDARRFQRRNGRLPGRCLPTPATLCELVFPMEGQAPTPQTGLLRNKWQLKLPVRLQSNACRSLTCFVSTRPSLKDCSQEGISESPRFEGAACCTH